MLTIRPLHMDLLQPCAEILTDAFVDTAANKFAAYKCAQWAGEGDVGLIVGVVV